MEPLVLQPYERKSNHRFARLGLGMAAVLAVPGIWTMATGAVGVGLMSMLIPAAVAAYALVLDWAENTEVKWVMTADEFQIVGEPFVNRVIPWAKVTGVAGERRTTTPFPVVVAIQAESVDGLQIQPWNLRSPLTVETALRALVVNVDPEVVDAAVLLVLAYARRLSEMPEGDEARTWRSATVFAAKDHRPELQPLAVLLDALAGRWSESRRLAQQVIHTGDDAWDMWLAAALSASHSGDRSQAIKDLEAARRAGAPDDLLVILDGVAASFAGSQSIGGVPGATSIHPGSAEGI